MMARILLEVESQHQCLISIKKSSNLIQKPPSWVTLKPLRESRDIHWLHTSYLDNQDMKRISTKKRFRLQKDTWLQAPGPGFVSPDMFSNYKFVNKGSWSVNNHYRFWKKAPSVIMSWVVVGATFFSILVWFGIWKEISAAHEQRMSFRHFLLDKWRVRFSTTRASWRLGLGQVLTTKKCNRNDSKGTYLLLV